MNDLYKPSPPMQPLPRLSPPWVFGSTPYRPSIFDLLATGPVPVLILVVTLVVPVRRPMRGSIFLVTAGMPAMRPVFP